MNKLAVANVSLVQDMIRAATKASPEQRLLHQLHCVCLVGHGHSCHEVARCLGGSARSVERWVQAFGKHGVSGLRPRSPSGRPPRLSAGALGQLVQELGESPLPCGYQQSRWDGRLLMQHLSSRYGLSMGLRQCQRMLRRLRS